MDIKDCIYSAIDVVNEQIIDGPKITKSLDTMLLGSDSDIDSLSLINLIVAVEDIVSREFDKHISIMDEDLLSDSEQPLRTVASFVSFVESKV
jgi:acyl carrier protein